MILRRFKTKILSESLILENDSFRHLSKVLRIKKGHQIEGFNGNGESRLYKVDNCDRKQMALIAESSPVIHQRTKDLNIRVFFPLIRKDRLEWAVEKITELGAGNISFYKSSRSKDMSFSALRLKKISDEAERQSLRNFEIDITEEILNWEELILKLKENAFFWFDQSGQYPEKKSQKMESPVLLIGPEGGFDEIEIKQLSALKPAIKLNSNVLKVETAAVCALNWLSLSLKE